MLFVISPSKTLDFKSLIDEKKYTIPESLDFSEKIVSKLKKLSIKKMSELMNISSKLATLNVERYQQWQTPFTLKNARQAVYAFQGDVYTGLDASRFNSNDLKFLQKHLMILSGLYGLLRPLDLIQPYRLEMGRNIKIGKSKDLYTFWNEQIVLMLNNYLKITKSNLLINLASNEYFKSIDCKILHADIITPIFKDYKNGKYKIISFYAKKARGLMVHYAVKNKIKKAEKLKGFDLEGYAFSEEMSTENEWIFIRDISKQNKNG